MVYNITVKDMSDKRGRWKKGKSLPDFENADAFCHWMFNQMKEGEEHLIAYEVRNVFSDFGLIGWVMGSFTIVKNRFTDWEPGSFQKLVFAQYPEMEAIYGQ